MSESYGGTAARDPHDGWAGLVDDHSAALARYARHLTRSSQDAEDLVQDVYVRAFSHLDDTQPHNMGGWLNRIALNLVRDHARRSRRVRTDPLTDTVLDRCLEPALSAEEAVVDVLLCAELRGALDLLPLPNRDAVLLHDVEQLTYGEIAALTGVSRNTVASRIRRGRQQLAAELDPSHHRPASQRPNRQKHDSPTWQGEQP